MVSQDNASTGSGGKTSCVKKQKCILNNSQKARRLYMDTPSAFEPELTSEVTSDNQSNPRGHDDVIMETIPMNGIIETAMNEQKRSVWSVSNLKEMQYLPHDGSLMDASLDVDQSSLFGFVNSSNLESSEDVRIFPCIRVEVRTDVVLIDEDDDDVSLRERTVTDVSASNGNAAALVCGGLDSVSSGSSHSMFREEREGRGSVVDTSHEAREHPKKHKRSCCLCVVS